ncbi:MAG: hypothetical protein KIT26_11520, partial [Nitrosomonas sp.]|nr:hypothetical protein [Nitrosomonas sp.]
TEGRGAALKSNSKYSHTASMLRFFVLFCLALYPLIEILNRFAENKCHWSNKIAILAVIASRGESLKTQAHLSRDMTPLSFLPIHQQNP